MNLEAERARLWVIDGPQCGKEFELPELGIFSCQCPQGHDGGCALFPERDDPWLATARELFRILDLMTGAPLRWHRCPDGRLCPYPSVLCSRHPETSEDFDPLMVFEESSRVQAAERTLTEGDISDYLSSTTSWLPEGWKPAEGTSGAYLKAAAENISRGNYPKKNRDHP